MASASDSQEIFDAEIKRSADFLAVSNDGVATVLGALDSADDELSGAVGSLLSNPRQPFRPTRLEALNRSSVAAAFKALDKFAHDVAIEEAEFQFDLLGGEGGGVKRLTRAEIRAAVAGIKFAGKTLTQHRATLVEYRASLILDEAESLYRLAREGAKINVKRLRLKGLERGRDAAAAIVRTYIPAVREAIRKAFLRKNPGLVKLEYWSAILDAHTTEVCRSNDGHTRKPGAIQWSNGYTGPYPAHYGERSRILSLTSAKVPKRQTFEAWLKSLSAADQESVLGPSRYRLWKKGKLDLRDFVTSKGRKLTLSELARRHPGAARKAGRA